MDFTRLIIDKHESVARAMKKLNDNSMQIVYVCDERKLLASLTDGDIRRFLLNGGSMESAVIQAAHYKPKYLFEDEIDTADIFMKKHVINSVPIVDKHMNIITVRFLQNLLPFDAEKKLRVPVVIQAGGLGKRLYPYTQVLPKPLIPIGDLPITEHIINRFVRFGCNEFYIIVNHKKNMIKSYFTDIEKDYSITFIDEEMPLGTGGGLSLLKGRLAHPFFLTNCDMLIEADYHEMYEAHRTQQREITLVCAKKKYVIPYGVIETDEKGQIIAVREKPEYSFLTYTGMSIVAPSVIEAIPDNTVMTFPDIYDEYRKKANGVGIATIDEHDWLDMGQMEELEAMKKRME